MSFHSKKWLIIETLYCVLVLAFAYHVVDERIDSRSLPGGDEGSWMAAAAELSKGNGFTTRWLEHGFLAPYAIPRPDDYRYPALVCLIAGAFLVFGCSYTTALWTVGVTFLLFGLCVWFVTRRAYGRRTAAAVLPLVCFSLLQLMYNTLVYTEALFGIGIALLVYVSVRFNKASLAWWLLSGTAIGLLYLIRPNGILFCAAIGFFSLWAWVRKEVPKRYIISGLVVMTAIMLPWLLRSWIIFGNPFHLAGSAGLLRTAPTDPCTYSILDFSRIHGSLYFLKATLAGIPTFFSLLHEQEHGLEVLPLFFCAIGIIRRRPFYGGMIATGFLLTLVACFYTSANGNWGGCRYFSPLLPFVYAFGIHQVFMLADRLIEWLKPTDRGLVPLFLAVIITGVLLLPIVYPHRYYERLYAKTPPASRDYAAYYAALKTQLSEHPFYYAGSLAQINFATGLNCVGMQHLFDESEVRRAQKTFHPKLMALRPDEYRQPYFNRLMNALRENGCELTALEVDTFAVLVKIAESDPLVQDSVNK